MKVRDAEVPAASDIISVPAKIACPFAFVIWTTPRNRVVVPEVLCIPAFTVNWLPVWKLDCGLPCEFRRVTEEMVSGSRIVVVTVATKPMEVLGA